jgi:hypothetical protein
MRNKWQELTDKMRLKTTDLNKHSMYQKLRKYKDSNCKLLRLKYVIKIKKNKKYFQTDHSKN